MERQIDDNFAFSNNFFLTFYYPIEISRNNKNHEIFTNSVNHIDENYLLL
jgi:hypothetical protein